MFISKMSVRQILCDKLWQAYKGRNQRLVDSMILGLGATDVEPVPDFQGSCPSKMYKIWHSCEDERLLRLPMGIVSFNQSHKSRA